MPILWGHNPLQESSSKTLVRFSAKQMTSLIKWVNTLPMLSLIATLTFKRSIFKANWAPRASRSQCHNKPHMFWKRFTKVAIEAADAQLASISRGSPMWTQALSAPPNWLCLPAQPETQEDPPSSSPYRRHFLPIWRHALFPFYSLNTYYWNTFVPALSTRDKAGNITDQDHSSVGLTFHLVSFYDNLVGVLLVCMRKGPFSVLCCPPFTPVEPEDRDLFLIQIYFSDAQVSSWHIDVASVRNSVWLYVTGTPSHISKYY